MNNLLMSQPQAGLFVFVLGLLVVFFGIAVIVLVISLVGKIMKAKENAAESSAASSAAVEKISSVQVESAPVVTDDGLTDEKVAAITAVLTAYFLAEGKSPCEFRIRKIKRL